jgi:hypothetical protein
MLVSAIDGASPICAKTVTSHSGADVPNATTVAPTSIGDMPKRRASLLALRTVPSAPAQRTRMPTRIITIWPTSEDVRISGNGNMRPDRMPIPAPQRECCG